ncbi:MAG: hemerythrin domain-containing protein, partial [Thermoanaerobaculia bacterium]
VNALRAQHEGGRGLIRELRDTLPGVDRGDAGSRRAFAATAMDYIGLLREHIRIEDHYFPDYANACFTPADDETLFTRMEAEDRARGIDGARFERMVAEYEEAVLKC